VTNWQTAVLHHLAQLPIANTVCHGDFHPDNIMLTPTGPIVIDWIDATQGHPAADITAWLLPNTAAHISEGLPPAYTDILLKIVRNIIQ